jgi:hypothetical protein
VKGYIPILAMFFVACACRHSQSLTFDEAKRSQQFQAMVESTEVHAERRWSSSGGLAVEIRLRRQDGVLVAITAHRATLTELALALSLTNSSTYQWPKAITDFETSARAKRQQRLHSLRDLEPAAPIGN